MDVTFGKGSRGYAMLYVDGVRVGQIEHWTRDSTGEAWTDYCSKLRMCSLRELLRDHVRFPAWELGDAFAFLHRRMLDASARAHNAKCAWELSLDADDAVYDAAKEQWRDADRAARDLLHECVSSFHCLKQGIVAATH